MRILEELICEHCGKRTVLEQAQGDLVCRKPSNWGRAKTAQGYSRTLCPDCIGRFKERSTEDKVIERLDRSRS